MLSLSFVVATPPLRVSFDMVMLCRGGVSKRLVYEEGQSAG